MICNKDAEKSFLMYMSVWKILGCVLIELRAHHMHNESDKQNAQH